MNPIIPTHREQFLRKDEARILTVARLPSSKANPLIAAQLEAYSFAEDLFDIHNVTAAKYQDSNNSAASHRADMHRTYAAKAHQLKLLALDTLSQLI